jgi:hypothetical protein
VRVRVPCPASGVTGTGCFPPECWRSLADPGVRSAALWEVARQRSGAVHLWGESSAAAPSGSEEAAPYSMR